MMEGKIQSYSVFRLMWLGPRKTRVINGERCRSTKYVTYPPIETRGTSLQSSFATNAARLRKGMRPARIAQSAHRAGSAALALHAEVVADGIVSRETKGEVSYGVLDPAAFAEDGGKSIADRMAERKVWFRPADNARVARLGAMGGWDQLRARLVGDGNGNPMIVCFSTCLDSIRTIPAMQHDQARPEEIGRAHV